MVFGQLAVQCNSQLADETAELSHQETKAQLTVLTVVYEIKRASRALSTYMKKKTNDIR